MNKIVHEQFMEAGSSYSKRVLWGMPFQRESPGDFFPKGIPSGRTKHSQIAEALNVDFYFAKPCHSWQRGANENLNGLIRQYFPKGTDLSKITIQKIKEVEAILNNRPGKRFKFKSPKQMMAKYINKNPIFALIT